jgi:glycine/D-amino acid oxidase-like deaminating enzyme
MYTGNEQVWPYLYQAQPAPRGHKVPVCGETCGAQQVIDRLLERAQQLGASFRYETAVTALVTDADRVVGAQWRQLGESGTARAAATVLAAGGFIMNEAMMAQYLPQFTNAGGIVFAYSPPGPTRPIRSVWPRLPRTVLQLGDVVDVASERGTSALTEVRSPPKVKGAAYAALPRDRSNAPHGALSCAARNSGCL